MIAVLAAALVIAAWPVPLNSTYAQDEPQQCTALAAQALEQAQAACADLAPSEVCEASSGTISALDTLQTIPGAAADTADAWPITVLSLPVEAEQVVTAVLYGGGEMARQPDAEPAAFTLWTGDNPAACAETPSGLLLQSAGEQPARVIVNGVALDLAAATVLVRAVPDTPLDVLTLDGAAIVTVQAASVEVPAGSAVSIVLPGTDEVVGSEPPALMQGFPFAAIAYAPAELLPDAPSCRVGVIESAADVTLYEFAGTNEPAFGPISPEQSYLVTGEATAADGALWWQLSTASGPAWVAQDQVRTFGACEEGVLPNAASDPVSRPPADGAASGVDFTPAANTVWQMVPGEDHMTGECSGAPALNFCDHLAAIAPAPTGIQWKGMEATPYMLEPLQSNVYTYSGRNALDTGTVEMVLQFTSDSTLTMTQTLTLDSEPSCQHVYYYSGEKNW
jgi:hypothetical protein